MKKLEVGNCRKCGDKATPVWKKSEFNGRIFITPHMNKTCGRCGYEEAIHDLESVSKTPEELVEMGYNIQKRESKWFECRFNPLKIHEESFPCEWCGKKYKLDGYPEICDPHFKLYPIESN